MPKNASIVVQIFDIYMNDQKLQNVSSKTQKKYSNLKIDQKSAKNGMKRTNMAQNIFKNVTEDAKKS